MSENPLFILYGSATGNAEHIAKDLAGKFESLDSTTDVRTHFTKVICAELDQFKKQCQKIWEKPPAVDGTKHGLIIVASTTGNGDAPENAGRFVRYVKRKQTIEQRPLQHLAYAVLGLGDTNYDQFCGCAKLIDKKMEECGGIRIQKISCADEGTGLEDVVEPFTTSIFENITNACRDGKLNFNNSKKGDTNKVDSTTTKKQEKEVSKPHDKENGTPAAENSTTTATTQEIVDDKKTNADTPATTMTSTSSVAGVSIVRALLKRHDPSIDFHTSLDRASLPSISQTKTKVCQWVSKKDAVENSKAQSKDDHNDDDEDDDMNYTQAKPFASSLVKARYLTKTTVSSVPAVWKDGGLTVEEKLLKAQLDVDQQHKAGDEDNKRVMEVTLALPDSNGTSTDADDKKAWKYVPGDSIGLVLENESADVKFIIEQLSAQQQEQQQKDDLVVIDGREQQPPVSLEALLRKCIDLSTPIHNPRILSDLSAWMTTTETDATSNDVILALQWLSSKTSIGNAIFDEYIVQQRRTVMDVLRDFGPHLQKCLTLDRLIQLLPSTIPPRYYSISSSPLGDVMETSTTAASSTSNNSNTLTVAFSVVDYETPSLLVDGKEHGLRRIRGRATRYLEALGRPNVIEQEQANTNTQVPLHIFPKPTEEFHMPESLETPMILIGPGTGIAPFVGFLKHRHALLVGNKDKPEHNSVVVGDVEVYFGCRHEHHDWIYRDELEMMLKENVVTQLHTAFSRDSASTDMKYVQHLMQKPENAGRLATLMMEQQAVVYICGDGNSMAKDVQRAIVNILKTAHFNDKLGEAESDAAANEYLEQMKKEKRLLLDIWS